MKQLFALLATGTVIAMAPAVAQERAADPLGGLTHCFDDSEFRVTSSARLPASKQFREVQTRNGTARVSTVDGYRLMLHKDSPAPLVNLKMEKSADGQFEQDRAAVLAYMELFSDTRGEGAKPLEVTRLGEVEVMALNQPGIDGGGPLSFYSFTHQATSVIGTAYILSQPVSIREFRNYAEYTSLRDRFVGKLVQCMAQQPLPPRG